MGGGEIKSSGENIIGSIFAVEVFATQTLIIVWSRVKPSPTYQQNVIGHQAVEKVTINLVTCVSFCGKLMKPG